MKWLAQRRTLDFRQMFIKYAVIERRDGTIWDLYINPESADAFERLVRFLAAAGWITGQVVRSRRGM
jgi:hypothetical protein